MNQKQLTAEIIPAEKLPGDLRYELSLSPDHIVRQEGCTYLSMGENIAVFPDSPETAEKARKNLTAPPHCSAGF